MTAEQQKVLLELEEKIINKRIANEDTSWVETEEELENLKNALRNELRVNEQQGIQGTRIYISDYHNRKEYIIMENAEIIEKELVIKEYHNYLLWFTIIMIIVYLLLIVLFTFLNFSAGIWTVIILGIINLFLFFYAINEN